MAALPDRRLLDHWWIFVVRGAFALAFGIGTLLWPGLSLLVLLSLFAAFSLLDGVATLVAAFRMRSFGWPFLAGLAGIAVGAMIVIWPRESGLALLLLIGAFAVWRGIFDVVAAIRLRRVIDYEWALGASGVVSILFGALMLLLPAAGALALAGLIAGTALAIGLLLVIGGLRLRRMRAQVDGAATSA